MDTAEYLALVEGGIDTFTIEFASDPKPAASHSARILRKVTTAICMTGVAYESLRVNKGKETGPLPWGTWKVAPYVIEHRGQDYARLYLQENGLRCVYLVDGDVVDRETFQSYLVPSARNAGRPNGGTISVKMSGIRLVGEPTLHH